MALDASKMRVYEVSMVDDVAPVLTLFILGFSQKWRGC